MSSSGRRAARPAREPRRWTGRPRLTSGPSRTRVTAVLAVLGLIVQLVAVGVLVARLFDYGEHWWGTVAAVVVSTLLAAGLASRTGGRPWIFGGLALAIGVAAVTLDIAALRTGASVITAVLGAVYGVMLTQPAKRFRHAVREVVIALMIGAVGGLAALGYEPLVSLPRWEFTTLGLALGLMLILVYRLGAGLHGLGRRGLVVILAGTVLLVVSLAYAELLRRYGSPAIDEGVTWIVRWSYDHLGAFPRPLQALLGIPALVWGCHQRARRRQGWWACAFGVAATLPVAHALADPGYTLVELGLIELYSLILGLVIGYVVIRIDLRLTGSRGAGARRVESETALRPEPVRWHSL